MADLTVATKNGAVRGKHVTAGNGSDVRAFLGIPFAKAGRWQKPAPADEWEGVRDATAFGAPPVKPPEVIAFIPIFKQSGLDHHEECLFLNIWSPPVSQIPPQGLPVMAWIYGGALASGETSMPLYEGQNLVAKAAELGTPVILVSIQYRINVFGFLASKEFQEWNEDGSAGNLGFYDQRMGLKWIKDNIANFGGDPSNVTVFGESAGAVSTDLQSIVQADSDEKLFKRAILQSGTAMTMPAQPIAAAQKNFDLFYSKAGGPADLQGKARIEWLLERTTDELLEAHKKSQPQIGFTPVIDGVFLKESPAMAHREIESVLCGTNLDEGTMFAMLFLAGGEATGKAMMTGMFPKHGDEILQRYTEKYGDFASAFDEYFNDFIFHFPKHMYSNLAVAQGKKVYRYRFEHPLESSIPLKLRVHHAAEIPFVFHQHTMLTPQELVQAERMVRHWTHFATHGHPGDDFPAYNDKKVLVYTAEGMKVEEDGWRKDAMDFWSRVVSENAKL